MPAIGVQCHELRVTDRDRNWRIVYRVAPDAVVILDVFSKKTDSTPTQILKTSRQRLAAYLQLVNPRERPR